MTNLQTPANKDLSMWERILKVSRALTVTHPSVTDARIQRRGQLLNAAALILTVASALGLAASPTFLQPFEFMMVISIGAFLLGKSKHPELGTFLFSFGFLSVAYLLLYIGLTKNYSALILSIVPITLIIANALLRQRVFTGLMIYTLALTFLAPLYSEIRINSDETMLSIGVITAIGIILYSINSFRVNLENARIKESLVANQQLQEINTTLESQIKGYSQEIDAAKQQTEEKAARLRIISEISQKISSGINMPVNEMLTNVAETISEKLGFYHVGIFLLDKQRQYAELRATNSEGGQRMLERHHQLKVGGTGIVGYVAQSGFPRIALSTGADAVFFNNPDLPDTRSEMAIPLKIGSHVIGVLDVQSPLPAAFSEEDTNIFYTLANQIALVVMRIQAEEEPAVQSGKREVGYISRQGKQIGYTYLADGTIAAAKTIHNPVLEKALSVSETIAQPSSPDNALPVLAIPVKIRDRVIGYIYIESADVNRKWTEDEILMVQSVSERAALTLENAHLFEETERRAELEQLMAQVTSRIGASNSFERILQTTIQEVGRTLKARRAYIQMESISAEEDSTTEQGTRP